MEDIIKKGSVEYGIAHQKLDGILEEVDEAKEIFFKTQDKKNAKITREFLKNYKFVGKNVENFGKINLKDTNYKIDLLNKYVLGQEDISYVKEEWNRWSE